MVELVTHLDRQVGTLLDHEFLPLLLLICCLSSIWREVILNARFLD